MSEVTPRRDGLPLTPDEQRRALVIERRSRRAEEDRRDDAAAHARDVSPALGTAASPASWRRAARGARVAGHRRNWRDGAWSFLYGADTEYGDADSERVASAARRARSGPPPPDVHGPIILPPVWTWEVPLYFWFGGIAAGSSFAALACDVTGDRNAARTARTVALAAFAPSPPLLIMDLGRPERFLNMLRIFKTRSPMSTGSWCLTLFGNLAVTGVGADLVGRPRVAVIAGGATAATGVYLGSYTAALLAGTAVPVWARSRALLPPIFIATATASGAAATRLLIGATAGHDASASRAALADIEVAAMTAELVLAAVNERRLGPLGRSLERGRAGRLFCGGRWATRTGLALRALGGRRGLLDDVPSILFLLAALAFRFGWLHAGRDSAEDHNAVALAARAARPERELRFSSRVGGEGQGDLDAGGAEVDEGDEGVG
jgi:formate-dependent nitrite reductase membrane component NrfD